MYVITGATGKVGKFIVSELLAKGKKVRALGRDTSKLKELSEKGATPLAGDLNDSEFVKKAFTGAEALSLMIPDSMQTNDFRAYARRIASNYINAVKQNRIRNVLILSSLGAQLGRQAGVDETCYELEKQFSELTDVNVLNLRSAFHMENLLAQIEMIINKGIISSPLRNDVSFPHICTNDVGNYAGKRLIELNFKGNMTEYVLGQKDMSPNEITSILAQHIRRPDLKYVQLKGEEFIKGFKQMGYSENVARGILEWGENLNTGKLSGYYKRTPQNTTPTTFEQFVQEVFVPEYQMHEVTI